MDSDREGTTVARKPWHSRIMPAGRPVSRAEWKRYGFVAMVLLPILSLYVLIRIYPIFETFRMSFFRWPLIRPVKTFIGLENYAELLVDPNFRTALWNTTLFAVVTVVVGLFISLMLALALEKKLRFHAVYETVYFMPVVTNMVAVSVVWMWIYDPTSGLFNWILQSVGLPRVGWLTNPDIALWSIMLMSIWKALGFNMVLLLVGLRGLNPDLTDAAAIDGANSYQTFRFVRLPLLKPILLYVTVTSFIQAYNVFTQVYVMTNSPQGTSGSEIRVLVYDIYLNAFSFFKMGYASAEATLFFLVVLFITLLQFVLLRGGNDQG